MINLMLGCFNLIPLHPLDGGKVMARFLPIEANRFLEQYAFQLNIALIGVGGHSVSCHAPDDAHRGERGPKCADCHTTAEWATAKFDHAKETGFTLEGIHARLDCADCHRTGRVEDPLPKDCNGCHRGEDAHATRFRSPERRPGAVRRAS